MCWFQWIAVCVHLCVFRFISCFFLDDTTRWSTRCIYRRASLKDVIYRNIFDLFQMTCKGHWNGALQEFLFCCATGCSQDYHPPQQRTFVLCQYLASGSLCNISPAVLCKCSCWNGSIHTIHIYTPVSEGQGRLASFTSKTLSPPRLQVWLQVRTP